MGLCCKALHYPITAPVKEEDEEGEDGDEEEEKKEENDEEGWFKVFKVVSRRFHSALSKNLAYNILICLSLYLCPTRPFTHSHTDRGQGEGGRRMRKRNMSMIMMRKESQPRKKW